MKEQETTTAMTRVCKECGVEKDLQTGFYDNPNGVEGKDGKCKECKKSAIAARRSGNKTNEYGKPDIEKVVRGLAIQEVRGVQTDAVLKRSLAAYKANATRKKMKAAAWSLRIDFAGYPDLYQRICEMAKSEIRRPEDQALYLLTRTIREAVTA